MSEQSQTHQPTQDDDRKKVDGGEFGASSFNGLNFQNFLASPDPNKITPSVAIQLQRTIGNQALLQLLRQDTPAIQRNGSGTNNGIDNLMQGRLGQLRDGNVALLGTAANHIRNLAKDTKGKAIVPDAKGFDRIVVKAKAKIATGKKDAVNVGDDIKDILRGTIVYDTFDELLAGYKKVFRTLNTYGLKIIKVSETYTDDGKKDAAARKNTALDTTGYGDAKMVFNLDIPKHIKKKYFDAMMFNLPNAIPVELQFQTKAGLAVKGGKLSNPDPDKTDKHNIDPDGEWFYRIDPGNGQRWRFNAVKFVNDILTKMHKAERDVDPKYNTLLKELPDAGLPPAHDIYDPEKRAALSSEDVSNADKFYPLIYDLAFHYSGKTDAKAQTLNKDVARILKRVKK